MPSKTTPSRQEAPSRYGCAAGLDDLIPATGNLALQRLVRTERAKPPGLASAISRSPVMVQRVCSANADESFYASAANYCRDAGGTGTLHPGAQCYREVPHRTSYFDCPPGDQVCFDEEGNCENSADKVSPVEEKNADGTCNLHGYCSIGHAAKDVIPWLATDVLPWIFRKGAEAQAEELVGCLKSCETLEGFTREMCRVQCHRDQRPAGM